MSINSSKIAGVPKEQAIAEDYVADLKQQQPDSF